jgi:TonB family protein
LPGEESRSGALRRFEARHPGVLHVGGDVKPPKIKARVDLKWPANLRLPFRELNPIMVEAVITESGDVTDPTIISLAHPELDPLVLAAVQQWKYEPARRRGKPVAVFLTITVLLEPTHA